MVLIMLGPPGVGKGTQGEALARDFGWIRLSTGDLLREARREGTELGLRAQAYMERGDLVPDELIVEMVRERLRGMDDDAGVILDGFPRTLPQAESLDEVLAAEGSGVDGVLLLTAPDEVLVKRISGRRSCPSCGEVYNVYFDPPEAEGRCDECGADLRHRDDDDAETVAHRLEVYREQTEPLVAYYRDSDAVVMEVDGDRSMNAVRHGLRRAIEVELGHTPDAA